MVRTFIFCFIGICVLIKLAVIFSDKIKFYTAGADSGFSLGEISLLWKLANTSDLEDPMALYWSVQSLNKSIMKYISDSQKNDTFSSAKVQTFLEKLYAFRTKIDIDSSQKKGIDSTKFLDKGQKLRIILPGEGVFTSEILNNGKDMIARTPVQNNIEKFPGEQWVGKMVSVYFWRKGDANYSFETSVTNSGMFNAYPSIYLAHSNQLVRSQKRKSVRAPCNLYADLYFFEDENKVDLDSPEKKKGFKCLLEDISEDGASIRCGGKGRKDSKIKLQFEIGQNLIIMSGMVRAVEYNEKTNQSRLHFECLSIRQDMKNCVLSFVYNILPQDQKDILEALKMTDEDAEEAGDSQGEDVVSRWISESPKKIESSEKGGDGNIEAVLAANPEQKAEMEKLEKVAHVTKPSQLPEMPDAPKI